MTTPVAFESFEHQKENILPLREGRSAAALQRVFSESEPPSALTTHDQRQQFEQALTEENLAELDDPLEPFLNYIQWTLDTYPSGASSGSGLTLLLERTTQYFRDDIHYRNDPRYLRVWMRYSAFSNAPRELFTYLARKEIGTHLATFYEQYAAFFESTHRPQQAQEVFEWGVSMEARPLIRLKRRFQEFKERIAVSGEGLADTHTPHSPVMPVVRPVLAVKMDATSATATSPVVSTPGTTNKSKMTVFADTENESASISSIAPGGWDTIGSLASRRKENTIEPKPWVGQTIPQVNNGGPNIHTNSKIAVFRDTTSTMLQSSIPSKPNESIAIHMEFLYDNQTQEEFCLEEILAKSRRLYKLKPLHTKLLKPKSIFTQSEFVTTDMKPPATPAPTTGSKRTIPLDNDSPIPVRPASPTMTMHSKAATNDIYDMFNQPLDGGNNDDDDNDDDDEEENKHYEMTGYGSDFTIQ
ncbi:hypothetical protein NADFUDRAFT_76977 [Nadsonia fulvescens var. elongata DSM 6958]|uniref:BUB1 N-terminal domain-containing protein n=1 Tax=Nadsonia fulvescens var. elongata DSM 6958 TaxID=857566 RepID=A0A1E3PNB4_9ASCO|nr:hypothetical protein NADFUDRAFT_76977 [Nadsonia fulvescens var. elongata DSM 6958]